MFGGKSLMNQPDEYKNCSLCPRNCHADRHLRKGYCQCTDRLTAARAALHHWEEPCISGTNGSGTVFFTGCTLRCCFCQNYSVSSEGFGKEITEERLSEIFLELQDAGAHNINLVTATQYLPSVLPALDRVKDRLHIPVVYNCGGYEKPETLARLRDYVDIYLPDLKYYDSALSMRYSMAPDYFSAASKAIPYMIEQTGAPRFDDNGLLKSGVIIRHMVLPGCRKDSIRLLHWIKENLPDNHYLISLLSQFTPFYKSSGYPEINRRITTYEYESVLEEAVRLGLTDGYMQEKSSAKEEYTPPFDLEGI
ncbi:MAG: radical SAM protein [Blautia sp.]|jgi:putative pyruvate formate lyase activating enzyme|uniref:Radical SAM protein n=3 Tax=Blautia TaxID=572511 RepID=A0ABR7FB31_9FIRM|nr:MULTISPECIES: radical SAM protein [Blautia]MBS5263433.1 radical SAM protein [Clostridiales bacterium]MCI5964760.1 radical SAM protein [Clostridia bacterium]MCQ4738150.1 radical SAM protein [Blautia hominis]UOX58621.1 radical SAM protein [Clostridia bacterium UC5.1-1D4]MBC5672386.1 radical SAM protein [Blautia celeris]